MKSKKSKIRKNEFLWRITSAIDRDNTEALCEIISELALKTDAERLLGKALTESSKALKINGTKYLLDQNAPVEGSPDSPSPLLLALRDQDPNGWPDSWVQKNKKSSALVEQNSRCRTAIIEMLLDHGANTEAVDEEGRTPLLITSFAGSDEVDRVAIVDMLLQHGANTEAVDKEGKTPLILALHQKHQGIVDILIDHGANVNAKDHLQRNSLNIIAADDESSSRDWSSTINSLLQRKVCTSGPEAQDEWGRTPLHWACASGNLPLAKQLLSVSMIEDKDISSNTALHLAASLRTSELVALLISHHADVNARSEGGWTPLHRASDVGHVKTVQVLLNAGADVNAVLLNKKSSLHLSAQNGHLKVVQLLLSRHDLTKWPTKDAFNKTAFMRAAQKKHQDVVHILDPTRLLLSVSDDVIGACKGFGATVMDFGDYRNGIRSREMTVFNLLHQRNPTDPEKSAFSIMPKDKKQSFTWVHFPANNVSWIETFLTKWFIENDSQNFERYQTLLDSLAQQEEGDYAYSNFMRPSTKVLGGTLDSWIVDEKKRAEIRDSRSIFAHIPYLHFETAHKLREMKEAVERKDAGNIVRPRTCDEMLIYAYLDSSTSSLNIRRTLDESFNSNIKTSARDEDQVVFEHQSRTKGSPVLSESFDPKIIMVDQLWIWVIGSNLVLTSFPQRWQQPKNDEFNIVDEIKEKFSSRIATPGITAHDLALIITDCAIDAVNGMGFWNAYNSYISNLKEDESWLYNQFNADSLGASSWLKYQKGSKGMDWHEIELRGPSYIDSLLEIRSETTLLSSVRKIREELVMIKRILEDQLLVLPDFDKNLNESMDVSQRGTKRALQSQIKSIKSRVRDMERMDKQAERVYASITDLLDLKQKSATVFQARLMSDQLTGSAKKREKTVLVFTIVTIIFLPLSFIASFFTINIAEFPKDPDGLPLAYVLKWVFGIGLAAVAVPLILVALSLDDLWGIFRAARQKMVRQDSEFVSKRISAESNLTNLKFRGTRRGDVETALEPLPIDVESKSSSVSF